MAISGDGKNGDRHVHIFDELLDKAELLVVFFAKDANIRLDEHQEASDNGEHSGEVVWPIACAEMACVRGHGDGCGKILRIYEVCGGHEEGVDGLCFGTSDVLFWRVWVLAQIFMGGELGGIEEDAHDTFMGVRTCDMHKMAMGVVEGA